MTLDFTPVISSCIFCHHLPSELTEQNSTNSCHMFRGEYSLKMHVQNLGYLLPPKNWQLRNHVLLFFDNHKLATNIFRMKHDVDNRGMAFIFTVPCVNSALFIASLCTPQSTNGTQPNFACLPNGMAVNCANKLP